ncbi:LysM peptidoglycan-binding domain-containing protein [Agreia pratensis]|uniref:LysM peptidoglycan-binding domain-containing protein n=1 Tax=Agreia pratensis TaxID=150121 RepID=UPI00188C9061|nr:LysM peptidoglycan-binding domain-containing protein [Agreia pratensis]MBF4635691.1 LysM peptidoglycan-binding domain-containing protein [Agreia pratensis]
MSWKRRTGAIAATSALLMLLTACVSSAQPEPPIVATQGAAAAPAQNDTTSQAAERIEPGTEVASAVFAPRSGVQASGSFTITVSEDPGTYEIVTHDLTAPPGSELTFLPYTIDASQPCADSGFRLSFGDIDSTGSDPHFLPPDLGQGDPTFFGSAVLTQFSEVDREKNDCAATVIAAAPIAWTLSPRRPDLKVTDTGKTAGASGVVAVDGSGATVSYTVARGDTLSNIADRFGISVDDIFYLNPTRLRGPQDPTAYTGEVLNLSVADR